MSDPQIQLSEVSGIVEKGLRSYDPATRMKAHEFRAWQQAGIDLMKCEEALTAERTRFAGRRADLEIEVTAQSNAAAPIITRERAVIENSQRLIAEVEGRVDAARAMLDKEVSAYNTVMEGLRSAVTAATHVVERLELK